MPELPDVEAVRRYLLSRGLVGRTVLGAKLLWPRAIREPSASQFRSEIRGRKIHDVRRRAKYLILELNGLPPRSLVFHLRMTGGLVLLSAEEERPRHTRNVLVLSDRWELCFVDPRKLGMMWLVEHESEVLAGLGPEPLDPAFTTEALGERLLRRNAPVKALLCDQAVVAGIGNIYADEILFSAGIRPMKIGTRLRRKQLEMLHRVIVERLSEAVEALTPLAGSDGPPTESERGRETLRVPRSEGAPCTHCGTLISRLVVRGRSSYFCSKCQTK